MSIVPDASRFSGLLRGLFVTAGLMSLGAGAFTVDEKLGGWAAVQKTHFADGGIFDQIAVKR